MLKVNLMPAKTDWRKRLGIGFASVSLLGLLALVLPVLSGTSFEPRPLRIEEQETVVAVAERLEARVPELAEWLKDFRISVTRNDFETMVQLRWRKQELVAQTGRALLFSNQFFDADGITQEQALLQLVVTQHSQIDSESDIAYGHE